MTNTETLLSAAEGAALMGKPEEIRTTSALSFRDPDGQEQEIAERFVRETANHQMTVLHDDGLYRHLRFTSNPRAYGEYWFDLITIPHALIFRGDGESFVFSRLEDMFQFFRTGLWKDGSTHINPGYWAEKLTSDRGRAKEYSKDVLFEEVADYLADFDDRELADRVIADLKDDDDNGMVETIEDARSFLYRWEDEVWSDTWEWDLQDYNWWFLWACHAIVWGIGQYDAARKPVAA